MKIHKMALAAILAFTLLYDGLPIYGRPVENPVETEVSNTTVKASKTAEKRFYTIHGITLPEEWQKTLYNELKRKNIEWYMPYAVCQIYQESRWNQYADNGVDKGITQQKAVYWYSRAERYGVKGASIWDVNAQFRVYASMMAEYLRVSNNDIGWALSYYFYGSGQRADKYVSDVLSHLPFLAR